MRLLFALPLSLLIAIGATGCGRGAEPGSPEDTPVGRTFLSTSITENGKTRALHEGTRIRLSFGKKEMQAHAGCNHFSGTAEFDSDRLTVTNLGGTEMGCEPELMKQDKWLTTFLESEPTWRLDGDTLVLTQGDTEIQLTDRRVADPDRPLQGTRWTVDSLHQGDTESSVPTGAKAYIIFGKGGKATGNTGCNSFSVKYEVDDDAIMFSTLTMTRMACGGDAGKLERTVARVFEGTVRYEIEADRLTLTPKSGPGLGLQAT